LVFLSPNSITGFKKSLTDLRNKIAIDFLPENVDAVTIAEGAKKTTFRKSGDEWRLDAGGIESAKADSSEVQSFLGSVQFARATDFADPQGFDLKKAGLDPPVLQLTVHDGKANLDHVLSIGKESSAEKFFAKDASRAAIFILDKQIPEKLRQPLFAWRDKAIAKVEREKIDEIEIVRGTEKLLLKKSGTDWKLGDGRKVQSDPVLSMLDALDAERALDIAEGGKAPAGAGLDKPKLRAVMRQEGKDVVALAFGGESKKPEGVYVKRMEGPAMVVSQYLYDKFNVKPEDIVEKAAEEPAKPANP
jgi:hypothetical protein